MVSYIIKDVSLIMASLHVKLSEPLQITLAHLLLIQSSCPAQARLMSLTCQNQEAIMGDVACLPLARQLSFTPMSEDEVVL